MEINAWWPALESTTKKWLIAHNGEPLPADVVAEIVAVSGSEPAGSHLSDHEIDWIEAEANDE
ncbi:hypothetical protein [Microbacterium sp. SS28]|uniref:hypothetical protein n=1 Tax=Microbacterium sp. SS28 TaxID=2919948 RepID=UPI001FAA450E|nr:hypothetical protein [Microbacterium sp. SS28]